MNRPYRKYLLASCASILLSCSAIAQTQSTQPAKAKGHDGKEVSFEAIPLAEILKLAGVEFGERLCGKALANYLLVEAADGDRAVFGLPKLDPAFNDRDIILADRRDGSPLTARDGPRQIVVAGEKRQARWVRQVLALTIRSSENRISSERFTVES